MAKDRSEYFKNYHAQRKLIKSQSPPELPLIEPCENPVDNTLLTPVEELITKPNTSQTPLNPESNFRKCFVTFVLGAFIGANTYFLVTEQVRFYKQLPNYTDNYAIFVSLLCESAALVLSFAMAVTRHSATRLKCGVLLLLTLCAIVMTIYVGIEIEQAPNANKQTIGELLNDGLDRLKEQVEGKTEKTPRLAKTLAKKENEVIAFLKDNISVYNVTHVTITLAFIRVLSVLWNIVLCSLLGSLWRQSSKV